MEKLKAQIRESFFNPILHIFPILVFLFVSCVFTRGYAWAAGLTAAGVITIYVYRRYKNIFRWYLFYMLYFIFVGIMMTIASGLLSSVLSPSVSDKLVLLFFLLLICTLRKPVTKLSDNLVPPLIPMTNNITEFYSVVKTLIAFLSGYLVLYFIFHLINSYTAHVYIKYLNYIYLILILALIVYESIKVRIIRNQLNSERWVPVITSEGKTVGTIQRLSSFFDRVKYTHPLVSGILIKDGMLFLQQPQPEELFYKPLWDSFIRNHINVNETAQDCLIQTAKENFGVHDLNVFYLTKYIHETPHEFQYIMVFIIGNYNGELTLNPEKIDQAKWWTTQQIEANLAAGIFTEQFVKEYDLLKRSGLLMGEMEDEEEFDLEEEFME